MFAHTGSPPQNVSDVVQVTTIRMRAARMTKEIVNG